eukprot:7108905-Alexandrium_andersonii.AAC.1
MRARRSPGVAASGGGGSRSWLARLRGVRKALGVTGGSGVGAGGCIGAARGGCDGVPSSQERRRHSCI